MGQAEIGTEGAASSFLPDCACAIAFSASLLRASISRTCFSSSAAVVGVPSGPIGERVVAALVLEAGARVDLQAVREWSEEKLSHYAIPRQIEILQELPKSQLGKTLRRKVQEQIMSASESMRDASDKLRSWREEGEEPPKE